jgi:hypothetical protein
MIYQRQDGSPSLVSKDISDKVEKSIERLGVAIKVIDRDYYYLTADQANRLKAMASHLMAMLEDE